MVRGVNKTVIEISNTDSGYFERAILFVNHEHSHLSQKRLNAEAEKYVDSIFEGIGEKSKEKDTKPYIKKAKIGRKKAIISLSIMLLGLVSVLFLFINIL